MFGFPISSIIAGVIMVLAFVGMLFCAKIQRSRPNAKFIAVALLGLVLICGGHILYSTMGEGDIRGIIENEMKYSESAAIVLGNYLGEKFPEAIPMVIVGPDYESNERQKMLVEGLKKGLKTPPVVEAIKVKKDPNMPDDMAMMMEEQMSAAQFNELTEKNKACDLLISIIGLPHDIQNMKIWADPKRKTAILFGELYLLKKAIASGRIVAVVSYMPGVKFDDKTPPSDPKEAFEKRYILITPENIKEMTEKYKGLFQE